MSSKRSQRDNSRAADALETNLASSRWSEIRSQLEDLLDNQKRAINEAILYYPPPIPACDVQFNHLLEQRSQVSQELRRLREFSSQVDDLPTTLQHIRHFINDSIFIDGEQQQKLLADLSLAQAAVTPELGS